MREDLADVRERVDGLGQRVAGVEAKVDAGFAEMPGKLDGTAAGLQGITALLNSLIAGQGQSDEPGGQRPD